MGSIIALIKSQLNVEETIIYLLIESGMTTRDLAKRLGVTQHYTHDRYRSAYAKVKLLQGAGVLSTPEPKKD